MKCSSEFNLGCNRGTSVQLDLRGKLLLEVRFVAFRYQRLKEPSCKWEWTHSWRVPSPFRLVIKVKTEPLDEGWWKGAGDGSLSSFISISMRVCSWCSLSTYLFVMSTPSFELIIRELGLCCSLVTRGCIVFLILPDNWAQLITVQGFDQWTNIHVQLTRNLRMIVTHVSFNEESTQLLGFARWDPSNVNFQSHIRWSHFEVNIWIIWMQ